jgi:hypothetical protein
MTMKNDPIMRHYRSITVNELSSGRGKTDGIAKLLSNIYRREAYCSLCQKKPLKTSVINIAYNRTLLRVQELGDG